MVLGVIAEHSLPFKMAPVMINLAKELSKDRRALNDLHMDRTSASYKTTYGLAKTLKGETLSDLRRYPFSLNMDESTSTGNKRVVTVLVSYYNPAVQRVVIEHLESFTVVKVDALSLFNCVVELFTKNNIPWENLVSILMDSCAVMRGKKSGLETRIREKVPHLIDVDGDVCHHMHNSCSTFCKPFDGFASKLFTDIHNDLKWSEDLKEYFRDVCEILDIKFTMPSRFVSHRWLSVYDISISTLRVWDSLQVFYFGFLPGDARVTYQAVVAEILRKRGVTAEGRARIREIQESLRVKWSKCTEDGKNRKKRIFEKVLYLARKTQLTLCFFSASLALLKQYVCLFQTSAPMVHKLHDQQEITFRDFLSCFVKPEQITGKTAKALKTLELTSDKVMKPKDMFLGAQTKRVIAAAPKGCKVVEEFMENVSTAYVTCGKYMQKKLPLDSEVLFALSCIDPVIRGSAVCGRELKKLPRLLPCNLTDEEEDMYELEVHQYQVDGALPPPAVATRLDEWWAKVFACGRYVALPKVVATALSIFHGPHVESSFNVMGDILDDSSCRMNISTYSSLQCIKYSLRSHSKTAIEAFQRKDILHDPVDRALVVNMVGSSKARRRDLEESSKAKMAKRAKLNMPSTSSALSKAKAALLTKKQEKEAREAHKMKRIARAAKLTKLAAKARQKKK